MKVSDISGAALVAFLALSAPSVQAYQGQGSASTSQPATPEPADSAVAMPAQALPSNLVGAPVYDRNGDRVGRIKTVLGAKGSAGGTVVVIAIHGFLGLDGKDVAVRSSDLVQADQRLVVDNYTKRELQRAPNSDL
jgi:hypothetical protein